MEDISRGTCFTICIGDVVYSARVVAIASDAKCSICGSHIDAEDYLGVILTFDALRVCCLDCVKKHGKGFIHF